MEELNVTLKVGIFSSDIGSFLLKKRVSVCVCVRVSERERERNRVQGAFSLFFLDLFW